ncbi:hypothetical protein ADUPG1_013720 [Aduncisulcus paluster]|uniref:Protein kinase domain-containing protein n=1 Tax=Aduncisulcus paluster TaxID=2918883 RepID=A0ABQ5K4F0_9EUKA|nr:hypothetical protein ADUPG1_013720 [Aduncisulcus paluster]
MARQRIRVGQRLREEKKNQRKNQNPIKIDVPKEIPPPQMTSSIRLALRHFRLRIDKAPLGTGGTASVCKAIDETSVQNYALKTVECRSGLQTIEMLRQESMIQSQFSPQRGDEHSHSEYDYYSRHVIQLHAYEEIPGEEGTDRVYFLMELAKCDLASYLQCSRIIDPSKRLAEFQRHGLFIGESSAPILTLPKIMEMFRSVVECVQCVHSRNILHKDIKPANFLLTDSKHLKICDFGISEQINYGKDELIPKTVTGTLEFMAPEFFEDKVEHVRLSKAYDVWSLGCLLHNMIYNQHIELPINNTMPAKKRFEIMKLYWAKNDIQTLHGDVSSFPHILSCSSNFLYHIYDLLQRCLEKNPSRRISIVDILSHKALNFEKYDEMEILSTRQPILDMSQHQIAEEVLKIRQKIIRRFENIRQNFFKVLNGVIVVSNELEERKRAESKGEDTFIVELEKAMKQFSSLTKHPESQKTISRVISERTISCHKVLSSLIEYSNIEPIIKETMPHILSMQTILTNSDDFEKKKFVNALSAKIMKFLADLRLIMRKKRWNFRQELENWKLGMSYSDSELEILRDKLLTHNESIHICIDLLKHSCDCLAAFDVVLDSSR